MSASGKHNRPDVAAVQTAPRFPSRAVARPSPPHAGNRRNDDDIAVTFQSESRSVTSRPASETATNRDRLEIDVERLGQLSDSVLVVGSSQLRSTASATARYIEPVSM
jgi:hypothetical protein